jgi:hypothetical protein
VISQLPASCEKKNKKHGDSRIQIVSLNVSHRQIRVGGYIVEGDFPVDWTIWSKEKERQYRRDFHGERSKDVKGEFVSFVVSGKGELGSGCGVLLLEVRNCGNRCLHRLKETHKKIRDGVWMSEYVRRRQMGAEAIVLLNVEVARLLNQRGVLMACYGSYSCDNRKEVYKKLKKICMDIKIVSR